MIEDQQETHIKSLEGKQIKKVYRRKSNGNQLILELSGNEKILFYDNSLFDAEGNFFDTSDLKETDL